MIALPSVILVFMYGQTRVFFVMARDGLLPRRLSVLNKRTGSPVLMTWIIAVFVAAIAGFFKLGDIAELSNAGTLLAFLSVAICVMIVRVRRPDLPRLFRTPMVWIVAPMAVLGCLYFLLLGLPVVTLERFAAWNAVGFVIYLLYGRRASQLARGEAAS